MQKAGRTRRVRVRLGGEEGPLSVTAPVSDVPTLSEEERREQLGLLRRLLPRWVHGESMELKLVSSILVGRRRYDTWWSKEILERGRPRPEQEIRPLLTFVFQVRAKDMEYRSIYLGPPFPAEGIEDLPPGRAAEQLAVVDSFAYDGRQLALEVYRRRAAARPGRPAPQYELAVMIWFHHFTGSPGPVEEAEPTLRRALELKPRAHAYHGLLGEILLRAGRERQALQAFGEAARLRPDHPRYHYCASVAYEAVGDAVAAKRALTRAKRVAGPKLQERFTRASNPLEDYRYSLLCEAGRLRERHEGLLRRSDREIAERFRTENTIRRSEVPRDLQELVPLAEKWGIGDEPSREYFVRRATREEKEELRRAFRLHGRRISEWLDSLSPDRLSPESGAFLYLLEACEEMGPR